MARSSGAAGLLLAGVGLGSRSAMEEGISALASAGIRAFLLPGILLSDPGLLASLSASARRAAAAAGLGEALVALGGAASPGFGLPYCQEVLSPLGLAALRSRRAAFRSVRRLGRSLAAGGVDLVLGPRLDLASDPKDPAGVLDRFGEEPELAGLLAAAFVRGLASTGAAACVGRFPGLGAARAGNGDGVPSVCLPAERLEAVEMRPFERAARARAGAVLVGRALVPALEPERIPAARSARVIEGRLREALGFRGLVVGDDLCDEADPAEAALLGALAGCDLGLVSRAGDALAAAKALEAAASSGKLPLARVAVARRRLDAFLATRALAKAARAAAAVETRPGRIERDREESLTLLKGDLAPRGEGGRRLVLAFLPGPGLPEAALIPEAAAAIREGLPGAEIVFLPADPSPAEVRELAERVAPAGQGGARYGSAVALTYDAHFKPAQEGLARLVEESVPDFCVVAMRDPYDAAFFPRARGLAAAYGFSRPVLAAVARLLSGGGSPRGRCPVEVIGLEV